MQWSISNVTAQGILSSFELRQPEPSFSAISVKLISLQAGFGAKLGILARALPSKCCPDFNEYRPGRK